MEPWKSAELQHFLTAFKSAGEKACGSYEGRLHSAAQLFSASGADDARFADKRERFRTKAEALQTSSAPDSPELCELALSWAEANLHADTSDDDWFDASTEHIVQLGNYCQSREGLDSLLWSHNLGMQLHLYSFGLLPRLYAGKGDSVGQLLQKRIHHDAHRTLRVLNSMPHVLDGLGSFIRSEAERKGWIMSGANFIGRLLYTHALCTGIERLVECVELRTYIAVVNGAIASRPCPDMQDWDFTFMLCEKMGAPHHIPEVEPRYFEGEAWCQRLLAAAQAYLNSFQRVFVEGDARLPSTADAWKQMASALQVFSELVLVYKIGAHKPS